LRDVTPVVPSMLIVVLTCAATTVSVAYLPILVILLVSLPDPLDGPRLSVIKALELVV